MSSNNATQKKNSTMIDVTDTDFPKMYWGVSSGGSISAMEKASKNAEITHRGHTIDTSNFPTPQRLEISYATQNNHRMWEGPKWFVDCGGYTELNRSEDGTYSSDVEAYIEYLLDNIKSGIDIEYWALRDWPVENDLLRTHNRTERDHQRRTIESHHKSLELAHEMGLMDTDAEPIAVLQGKSVDGYLWMLDHLQEQGLLTDHVCLGSIKDLKLNEAVSVAEKVREALPSRHTIHGLGVTKTDLKSSGIVKYLDTVDTQTWNNHRSKVPEKYKEVRNTWIGYLHAYDDYRREMMEDRKKAKTQDMGEGTQLSEFLENPTPKKSHENSMIKCICGSVIDSNKIVDHCNEKLSYRLNNIGNAIDSGNGCRHCRRKVLNILDREQTEQSRSTPAN